LNEKKTDGPAPTVGGAPAASGKTVRGSYPPPPT